MKYSTRSFIYFLPCKPHAIYVNVTEKCMNDCLFCIKRDGPRFFGYDLSLREELPTSSEIIDSLSSFSGWKIANEVVFCGMGEPLLRYECVLDVCRTLKESQQTKAKIRVDTSGLFWINSRRLDILNWIDILSVSLNAENAQKYEELCRPKIRGAYNILMDFLSCVKNAEIMRRMQKLRFPEVYLSIVDTSEEEFIPLSGRKEYVKGTFPIPNFDKCNKIASYFGWPLIVKRLFRDSRDEEWNDPSIHELCSRGISPNICNNCSYRH